MNPYKECTKINNSISNPSQLIINMPHFNKTFHFSNHIEHMHIIAHNSRMHGTTKYLKSLLAIKAKLLSINLGHPR